MIIDSSAILAILSNEPEAAILSQAIEADTIRLMSAASLLETAIVIEARYGPPGSNKLDELISAAEVGIEPVTLEQITIAR
jgi:ribonuclease VapC